MDEERRETLARCPKKDTNNLRTGLCERPLEAEAGHCDDSHSHDGSKGIHGHCPIHGAIFINLSRTTINTFRRLESSFSIYNHIISFKMNKSLAIIPDWQSYPFSVLA